MEITPEELETELERYDNLIKYEISKCTKEQLDIAEKCSYTDVCKSILKRVGIADPDAVLAECYVAHDSSYDFEKLTELVFQKVCECITPRYALIGLLYGVQDSIKVKETLEQVIRYLKRQDNLIDAFDQEVEESNG